MNVPVRDDSDRTFSYRGHRIRIHGARLIPDRGMGRERRTRIAQFLNAGAMLPDGPWLDRLAADLGVTLEERT